MATVTLKGSNQQMPLLGFGLWKIPNAQTADTVYAALKAGYRLLDGAGDYGNEKEAGDGLARAIKDGIVKREEVFVTSKVHYLILFWIFSGKTNDFFQIWNTFHAPEHVAKLARLQLQHWGLEYFDLFHIHFPIALKYVDPEHRYPPGWQADDGVTVELDTTPIQATYQAFEKLHAEGLIKNIGVSNFNGSLLLDVLRYARIPPAVLQIEHHPYLVQQPLVDLAKAYGIAITGYCSFGPASWIELDMHVAVPSLLEHNEVTALASKYGKTTAQILLRWALQRGIAVIPKSSNPQRVASNLQSNDFTLADEDIQKLSSLDQGLRFNNPSNMSLGLSIFAVNDMRVVGDIHVVMDDFKLLQGFGQLRIDKPATTKIDQEFLIRNIIESRHFKDYPPAHSFQKNFWKEICRTIEESGEEVDERIYERYMSLLPVAKDSRDPFDVGSIPSSLSYTTYFVRLPRESQELLREDRYSDTSTNEPEFTITLKESRMTIEQGTTGYRTWKPSLYLADWILRHPSSCFGKVLELGCGIGLLGTVIASIQNRCNNVERNSCRLHLTDIDEGVIKTCRYNMMLPPNHIQSDQYLSWGTLDWNDALPSSLKRDTLRQMLQTISPDVIFGADLVYDLDIIPALAHLLDLLLSCLPSKPKIWLTITIRRQDTLDKFITALRDVNLQAKTLGLPPFCETAFAGQIDAVDKDVAIELVEISGT
ncbi:NAD(P)H-dependent D-xylose reductase (XR) [Serendipita sp. 399]|nr:NAD(P)H-dependent D-xylose reductase (XR) [Serendipita sp. 399]